ncbi:M20 family metallopeptidase [Micromonospora sp. NBC_01392]|uniref:M20 metallopeptidase family protein n=1 Tax=Micromonospora sp. NBC_01392 TaxID=2903588 RepID=UPI00324BD0D7
MSSVRSPKENPNASAPGRNRFLSLASDAAELSPELVALRHKLHRQPEVGLDLPQTQHAVLEALAGLPVETSVGRSLSSVIGVIRGPQAADHNADAVILRADMDAIPGAEKTAVEYASTNGLMHACGHDLHTAMLVGAAHLLSARTAELAGDVILMFQPGEEGHLGAQTMLAEGLLDSVPGSVVAAYAIHVSSALIPRGVFASRKHCMMSGLTSMRVRLVGTGTHASTPHLGQNPVLAASDMILSLQAMVTRRFDVFDPVVLTIVKIEGGQASNAIPECVVFEASVRAFSERSMLQVIAEATSVIKGIASLHGVAADVSCVETCGPVMNAESSVELVEKCVSEIFGPARYQGLPSPLTASEDFSEVLERVPGAIVLLGAHPSKYATEDAPFNHSPSAEFDDGVIADGAMLLTELAIRTLADSKSA